MSTLLCLLGLIFFTVYSVRIFRKAYATYRTYDMPDRPGFKYVMSQPMYYLTFIVCSAPLFLGQLSLLKYLLFFLFAIWILTQKGCTFKTRGPIAVYIVFLLWLLLSCFRSAYIYPAVSNMIKYLLPLVSFQLAYNAIENKYDLYFFCRSVAKWVLIYTFFLGGICAKFAPALFGIYGYDLFLTYAGLADYFTSLFVVPIALVWLTGNMRWYWICAAMLASSVIDSVRTGIGGIVIVFGAISLFKYRLKSLPVIFAIGAVFLGIILLVPDVNSKFFGEKAGTVTMDDILSGDAMSFDTMESHGREAMWTVVMEKFYEESPLIGCGLGTVQNFMKSDSDEKDFKIELVHNDYVQMLSDTGIISVVLYGLFVLSVFFISLKTAFSKCPPLLKTTSMMAGASILGVSFAMGFDNVVSHSMTSLINPFIFLGFYAKFKTLYANGQLS